ncbi:hypothetical protein HHI36_017595 [Cryptolaemus montrouzieri]|uniref:Uncharacterized protein n=1 Tax=Cryptolaemus montrouzieri TaxID=559131 RepID=A0ABD2NNC1_9CUCU
MYVDIGVYGVPKVENLKPRENTRRIEEFVAKRNGFQMLYADTYTTREEFRKMFDHNNVEMYVDIGVYGVPKVENFKPRENTRRIEEFVSKRNGFQMLYADTYTTREEFRKMFDHSLYDKMRNELNCKEAFPEIYDKVPKEARR